MAMQPLSVGRIAANDDMLSPEDSERLSILVVPRPRELLMRCFKGHGYNDTDAETESQYLMDLAKEGHPAIANHFHICDETVRRFDEWQHCARDVVYFAKNYIQVEVPQDGDVPAYRAKYEPTEAQLKLLRAIAAPRYNPKARRIILVWKSRGIGFTTTTGNVAALHNMTFFGSSNIPLVSCDEDKGKEWIYSVGFTYDELPDWLKMRVKSRSIMRLEFENRSRMKAWAATSGSARGQAITMILIDEAAQMQKMGKWHSIFQAANGTATRGGVVVVGSTPNCAEDSEYIQWCYASKRGEEPGVEYLEMLWDSMPGRDKAWLARERKRWPSDAMFATEILARPEGSSYPCMPTEILDAWTDDLIANPVPYDKTYARMFLPPQNPEAKSTIAGTHIVRRYRPAVTGHQYMSCFDISLGRGKDRHGGCMIDFTTMPREVVLVYHSSHNPVERVGDHAVRISNDYERCKIIPENKGINQRLIGYLENNGAIDRVWRRPPKFRGFGKFSGEATRVDEQEYGFVTTQASKLEIMEFARNAIERQEVRIYDHALLGELKGLTVKGKRVEADGQGHDDLAMAFMICLFIGSREYHMSEHLTDLATHGPEYEAGGLMVAPDAYDQVGYLGPLAEESGVDYLDRQS